MTPLHVYAAIVEAVLNQSITYRAFGTVPAWFYEFGGWAL